MNASHVVKRIGFLFAFTLLPPTLALSTSCFFSGPDTVGSRLKLQIVKKVTGAKHVVELKRADFRSVEKVRVRENPLKILTGTALEALLTHFSSPSSMFARESMFVCGNVRVSVLV